MHRKASFLIPLFLAAICVVVAERGQGGNALPVDGTGEVRSLGRSAESLVSAGSEVRWEVSAASDFARIRWDRPAEATKASSGEEKTWRSAVLDLLAIGMGIGEVTGTAEKQIVLIDPSSVYVYSLNGREMTRIAAYDASPFELKSVDVARIRKQGPARIYVTAQNRSALASFVLEYRNGALVPVIKNISYYLRVILYPSKGPILLGQRRGIDRTYEGPILRLDDKGDELREIERFGVPLKIPIFGFCIGDLEGKRQPGIAVYDRSDHLRLYHPSGKRFFLSKEYYGGSDVILRQSGSEGRVGNTLGDENEDREYYRPRIMALNLEGRGPYEILAIMHHSKTMRMLGRFKMLEDGQVVGLAWNGDALERKWQSPKIQGMITDFAVDTLPVVSGPALITVERQKTDWLSFLSSKSQVRAYSLRDLMERGVRLEKEE
ncbi:MAG: hypothetical protein LDL33_04410 [Desulfomonile sp.]|nr:hypothetical protein [Desulfomonile sp.]